VALPFGDFAKPGLIISTTYAFEPVFTVKLKLAENGNGGYATVAVADLAECDTQSGAFLRNIVKSIHPSTLGIQPAEFLI